MSLFIGGGRKNPLPAPEPEEPPIPDAPGTHRMVLGPVHHAEAGTPIRYYWRAITIALDYTGIVYSHEGNGTSHADRYEWTPGPGDVGTHEIVLIDSGGGRRTQTVIVHPDSGAGTMRSFLNGDSISAWDGSFNPWVPALRARLVSKSITANFSGPRQQSPNPIANVYHNAEGGRTYGLGADVVVPNPASALASWVTTYGTPTHAVCALGTNDHQNYSEAQSMIYARAMVNAMFSAMPTAKKAITLMYQHNPDPAVWGGAAALFSLSQSRFDYLEALQAEFASEITSGDLHLLNVHGCCTVGDYYDGLHPDGDGHPKILDQVYPWYRAVTTGAA